MIVLVMEQPLTRAESNKLDSLLASAQLPREILFLTHILREQTGRLPTTAEIDRDRPDLEVELNMIDPPIILTLGKVATCWFLGDVRVEQVHGLPHDLDGWTIFPTYSLPQALHSPELSARLAHDLVELRQFLDATTPQ